MIKNIIFDLGGVIYDIRYENIAEAFIRMGSLASLEGSLNSPSFRFDE